MKSPLSDKQKLSMRESNRRLNIWVGAVRSGKTFVSILRFIWFIAKAPRGGELILVGKSVGAVYRNIIRPMLDLLGSDMHYYSGKQVITLWGREIFVFGAYDESSEATIRGLTVAGAYGDEITLWPQSFFKMLLSRMSVSGAKFFGSTNPDNPYHYLKTEFLDRETELDMAVFNFILEDNPSLEKEYVENLKKEYVGLWYKRFILGLWVAAEGAIYDFFDEKIHARKPSTLPSATDKIISIDYGTGNPTAFTLMERNSRTLPKIWTAYEYFYDSKAHNKQKSDEQYAADLVDFTKEYGQNKTHRIHIDPSAASFKIAIRHAFNEAGMYCQIVDADNDVINGIRTQARMLSSGEYAVSTNCPRTIQDYYGYSWDPKAQKRGEDKPLKTNGSDHTKDAERYGLYTLYGENASKIDYEALTCA